MRKRLILGTALIALAMMVPAAASAGGAVVIPFEKSVVVGPDPVVWIGAAGSGVIVTSLHGADIDARGTVWHVDFDSWTVFNSGTECGTFSADLHGVVNLQNGQVAMRGTVTDEDCEGSRIVVQATLDLGDFSSQGTMLITP